MKKLLYGLIFFMCTYHHAVAQLMDEGKSLTKADTLRGMLTSLRTCYDINYYHLDFMVDIEKQSISGSNEFRFTATQNFSQLQFDLFSNLNVDKVIFGSEELKFKRMFNAVFVTFPKEIKQGSKHAFTVYYSGIPVTAKNPPWDGGLIFKKDQTGNPWVSVACQGLGASSWWPNKDHQSDEVDSMRISITAPSGLQAISNGRLKTTSKPANGLTKSTWLVTNPINNYNITFYIGKYAHWTDQYKGENGMLSLDFWALKEDSLKARPHWDADVKPMLKSFEYWFGPYPFYKDGYKLVEAPHLGMEHQSAVAYGNEFKKGYLGRDISGSGWGTKFDFITVHESGHEWFGNNITSRDIADMWIHESFTNYSEALFIESYYGKKAASDYVIGIRKNIKNDIPIIGKYGANQEGSGDMYYKGANLIHTIRQLINNDEKFRIILRGLNKTFYHQTVTTAQIEQFIARESGLKLARVFDQYLRTIKIPILEYSIKNQQLRYRWSNVVTGFDMPVKVTLNKGVLSQIAPTTEWKTVPVKVPLDSFKVDPNFYVRPKRD